MHISEDKLIEYALEIVDVDNERAEIEEHLETCQLCRSRLREVRSDIDTISSIRLDRPVAATPSSTTWHDAVYPLLRVAALIVIGLVAGFGTSLWFEDKPARVVSQYVTLSSPADSVSRYAASDATDISSDYYRHMLQDIK
ncbi:MAG: hypothetical protein ABII79_10305 [bacterium]